MSAPTAKAGSAAASSVSVWLTPPVLVPAAIVLLIAVYAMAIHLK